ncbi:uncharacterized protein FOMMEDRAFT_171294 [Fomitiporia mediterranea MF3/22]|uniref:uncharacterized protein n=1 Tax=Fomitiporia mediterranea (strain MF3/22) TaxID=694068 RepID=UPI00044081E1|nr:uncharacterized protein FOMMEDRAFT_171294 [Fomitiporia mediterranea MF3/22]EJC97884.1 hypothetical protein FOMMEDRAFT_171294 [Fomitiporia mediterranea MF3/22]
MSASAPALDTHHSPSVQISGTSKPVNPPNRWRITILAKGTNISIYPTMSSIHAVDIDGYAEPPHGRHIQKLLASAYTASAIILKTQAIDYLSRASISTTPRHIEPPQDQEHVQPDAWGKRRRENITDGYVTDGSYAEAPPMSPFSSEASGLEGIDDIGDEIDSPYASDHDRPQSSTSAIRDRRLNEPIFPPKLPPAARPLQKMPVVSPILPNPASASSSVVQYSSSRLAERARLASLPTTSEPPAKVHTGYSARSVTSLGVSTQPYASGMKEAVLEKHRGNESPSPRNEEFRTDVTRPRRATINTLATYMQPIPGPSSVERRRLDTPASITGPDMSKIKNEHSSPPPLDLSAPEQPYSATYTKDGEDWGLTVSTADSYRRRKRSRSSASATIQANTPRIVESEQLPRRGDRSSGNTLLKVALESGDYEQIADNKWRCRVHNECLGGHRSVTRHHESVHLNKTAECKYCGALFSRRDAMLRHQRSSGCKGVVKQQF